LLANEFEADLPRTFRFLVRGLGSRETRSNDMLSLLMFQSDYIARVMELGEADARARSGEIEAFLRQELPEPQRQTARDTVARYLQAIKRRVARS
jgi:NTE family protein